MLCEMGFSRMKSGQIRNPPFRTSKTDGILYQNLREYLEGLEKKTFGNFGRSWLNPLEIKGVNWKKFPSWWCIFLPGKVEYEF